MLSNMKDVKYQNAPDDIKKAIEAGIRVKDFLPPPEKLITKQDIKKINKAF